MIGKLRGKIDSVAEDSLILDVGGVGYVVFASGRTLSAVQDATGEVALLIETHVREDHIHLFGFLNVEERDWFRLLTTVQGVGAKMGLAILAALAPDELRIAIAAQDVTALSRAHGVGKKLAERMANELKNKVASLTVGAAPMQLVAQKSTGKKASAAETPSHKAATIQEEATSALVNLGYQRSDAFQAVARAMQQQENAGLDMVISLALKLMVAA